MQKNDLIPVSYHVLKLYLVIDAQQGEEDKCIFFKDLCFGISALVDSNSSKERTYRKRGGRAAKGLICREDSALKLALHQQGEITGRPKGAVIS